jgi:tetratricopeptide (TPR) repeat protein
MAPHLAKTTPPSQTSNTRRVAPGILIIVAAVVVAYIPAVQGEYIWDDDFYVTENIHLRTLPGLGRIWFDIGATPQYYPAVHTTFWIEYHLWELEPFGYHLVNVLLHAMGSVLLWLVLRRLSVPGAWLAATLFALHPVQVESVAWITERKNVLSGVFYFAALLAYCRFAKIETDQAPDGCRWRYYGLAVVLFACALLSKTVTCTLPAVILLLLWWKRRRVSWREVLPLAPMLAVGLAMGLLTAWMEKHTVGARGAEWGWSFVERCLLAGRVVWVYLGKLVWPAELMFFYPRWRLDASAWWQYLFPVAAVAVPLILWLLRARLGKAPLVAALFFGGTLFPALGFIDVYPMRYSFVADHFQYLACAGPLALFAALIATVIRLKRPAPRTARVADTVVSAVVLLAMGTLTWRQGLIYKDVETLWRDTVQKNPDAWMAYNNLGNVLKERGQVDEALAHYRKALDIYPDCLRAHGNLAATLYELGEVDQAIVHLKEAMRLQPGYATPHRRLGEVLKGLGRVEEAVEQYRKALAIDPNLVRAHVELADLLRAAGQPSQAVEHYRRALVLDPHRADVHNDLGIALAMQGRLEEATTCFREAVRLRPDFTDALGSLGMVLVQQGRTQEALAPWQRSLQLEPDDTRMRCLLADLLLQLGRVDEAAAEYRKALEIDPDSPEARRGLQRATSLGAGS